MEEFGKFEVWVHSLFGELEWDNKGEKSHLPTWLKEREDAAFHWAWNRAARNVTNAEKKMPLNEAEKVWLKRLEITVEMVVMCALSRHDESSPELWACIACVYEDFQLLARAARLHLSIDWTDKLRVEYDAGRFPRGTL